MSWHNYNGVGFFTAARLDGDVHAEAFAERSRKK